MASKVTDTKSPPFSDATSKEIALVLNCTALGLIPATTISELLTGSRYGDHRTTLTLFFKSAFTDWLCVMLSRKEIESPVL